MAKLLIIDDDKKLQILLSDYLGEQGFQCTGAENAAAGRHFLEREEWGAVILDVMLPGASGLDLLRQIRADDSTRKVPVLMLTARGDEVDRVVGLEMGADDYLTKPFSARELAARIRALLRRAGAEAETAPEQKVVDDLLIHKACLRVTVGGKQAELTVPEMQLLEMLVAEPGKPLDRHALCKALFGHPAYPYDRSLDMLVSRLRKHLGFRQDGGERIKAVRGVGYVYIASGKTP